MSITDDLKSLIGERYRIKRDEEGYPYVPGRNGRIEWHDGNEWAAYTNRRRVIKPLLALPGVRRHQTGDTEARVLFTVESLESVAKLFRSYRKVGFTSETGRIASAPHAFKALRQKDLTAGGQQA
jgi:hypothetical protein